MFGSTTRRGLTLHSLENVCARVCVCVCLLGQPACLIQIFDSSAVLRIFLFVGGPGQGRSCWGEPVRISWIALLCAALLTGVVELAMEGHLVFPPRPGPAAVCWPAGALLPQPATALWESEEDHAVRACNKGVGTLGPPRGGVSSYSFSYGRSHCRLALVARTTPRTEAVRLARSGRGLAAPGWCVDLMPDSRQMSQIGRDGR